MAASPAPMTLQQRYTAYTQNLALLWLFLYQFLLTLWHALRSLDTSLLLSPPRLRSASFAHGLSAMRSGFHDYESTTSIPHLFRSAHGTILEIGAGIGNQVDRYDRSRIARIYGLEPNRAMIPALHDAVSRAGLEDKYTIVDCGVDDHELMRRAGITRESMDCVVSVQVLCSVPRPQAAASCLYDMLKPGGELIVSEHVRAYDWGHRFVQKLYNPLWRFALDGCSLDRPLLQYLLVAGPWERVEIERDAADTSIMPRISGRLVKPVT